MDGPVEPEYARRFYPRLSGRNAIQWRVTSDLISRNLEAADQGNPNFLERLHRSSDFDCQPLAAAVIAPGRARDMAAYTAAALRALGQLGRMPAVCRLSRA